MSPREENESWVATERDGCLHEHQPATSHPMHRPIIKIFIAYENDLNRDRAQFMQEELTRRLGQSFAFSVSWWGLGSLEDPEIRMAAARSIAEADIVCFSLLSGGEIPKHVTKWLEKELLANKPAKLCLLALVEAGGMIAPRLSRAEVYLSQLSLAAGVDCLCYSDSIPIVRSIRSKQKKKEPGKWTMPAKRALYGGAHSDQELANCRVLLPSSRRLEKSVCRENPQP
jgi:hypothetical protein